MASRTSLTVIFGATLLLSGCSYATDALWPSLTGDEKAAGTGEQIQIPPSKAEASATPTLTPTAPPPSLGTTNFVPPTITAMPPTGTFVGKKVVQMRAELQELQRRIHDRNSRLQRIRISTTQNSQRYHGTVAAINTRLQIGTTPGNPVLVSQWNQAQTELDRIAADIASMNSLANDVAGDSSMSAFLLESARATYGLSGAIDEDHRQLAILEDETNRTVVLIDRLLNELSEDISRQTAYLGNERGNLTTLSLAIKNGELYGSSLANRAYMSAAPMASAPPAATAASGTSLSTAGRRPLVVIRFDRPDVPYQQALYTAISKTLSQRPNAQFDLVAVVPQKGGAADVAIRLSKSKKHAQDVLRTLIDMGLPANRLNLSSTSSPQVGTNEVHIYVR